ncbi:hypothetical protein VCR26J2_370803 [Vibrio coralliirubri]|nr:hypothetical protein VCR26J2_370803 [Vibrio coralliirubri]
MFLLSYCIYWFFIVFHLFDRRFNTGVIKGEQKRRLADEEWRSYGGKQRNQIRFVWLS